MAVLGSGDPALAAAFSALAKEFPERVNLHSKFDEPFAHKLYASSDIFLIPSRFEPCGLGQMIAMRYGAVPVASRTGGLADTVFEDGPGANGFLCEPGDAGSLGLALDRALTEFGSPKWKKRVAAGMAGDFSWVRSMTSYSDLYARARA